MAELLLAKGKIMASYRLEDYDFVSLSKHAKKHRVHGRLLILAHVKMGKSITQAAGQPVWRRPTIRTLSPSLKHFMKRILGAPDWSGHSQLN